MKACKGATCSMSGAQVHHIVLTFSDIRQKKEVIFLLYWVDHMNSLLPHLSSEELPQRNRVGRSCRLCSPEEHYIKQTRCSRGCSTITSVINSVIKWQMVGKNTYLPNNVNLKLEELGSWYFERMFSPHIVSCVTCNMSCVTYHMSTIFFKLFHLNKKN